MAESVDPSQNLETVFVINQGVVIYMSERAAVFHCIFTTQNKRCQLPQLGIDLRR
jgi:hypothetical protein